MAKLVDEGYKVETVYATDGSGVENVLNGTLTGITETMKGRPVVRYSFGQISFYA